MIMYFSGTGNSAYVASRISDAVGDECIDLFDKLRDNDFSAIHSQKSFVVVTPTYCWQIPHILRDWLLRTELTGDRDIYFVLTCGDDIGNARKHIKRICDKKGMVLRGCSAVVMPENYIAMFDAPERDEALAVIEKAESVIDRVAHNIDNGENIAGGTVGFADRVKSGVVNAFYYPVCVHSHKFVVSDVCVGCGKCAASCVMSNITMTDGKPMWSDNCTHCMACICRCPVGAIEYGKASVGKPRYTCPK